MIKNFQEIISQIKEQIPIHELISEFIPLKKSGRGYVALCPFHNDHKPSLHINSEKGIFKCFSCGTGGDLIYFYSQINKKKFYDSVIDLATKYGFKLEYGEENKAEAQVKNQLFELNRDALEYFKRNLYYQVNNHVFDYLHSKRGYTEDTIGRFELGFAVDSWDSLLIYLSKEKKYQNELLLSSGLFIQKENNDSYYDRFKNRVIIPIFNESGNVVGFGGRTISNEEPKYLNSPETLIFNKGSCLYGLNVAKEEIKKSDFVILTEGYFDVITAHQNGFLNTVASLGTALTHKQARLLSKYTESKKLCLCMDSDKAGKKAVESIFKLINDKQNPIYLDTTVLSELGGKDLDETLMSNGKDYLSHKIKNGQKLIDFVIDNISAEYLIEKNENQKKNVFDQLLELICEIRDPIEQKNCMNYVAHKLNIEEELFVVKVRNKLKLKQKNKKEYRSVESSKDEHYTMHTSERFKHAEIELLSLYVCSFPQKNKNIKDELNKIEFIDEKHRLIKDYLDSISSNEITSEQIVNNLMIEFNEYKHIMAVISDIAWRINSESVLVYTKDEDKILSEAKEWINWWVKNKQQLKSLTDKLKDCDDDTEGSKILSEMIGIVKGINQANPL